VNGSYEFKHRMREVGELIEPPIIDAKPLPKEENH
jgi:hypothetical protein